MTLAPARPELLLNQLTGGSNTTFSTYTPIRVAAAIARQRLLEAAAILFGTTADRLTTTGGVISDALGNQRHLRRARRRAPRARSSRPSR